MCQVDEMLYCFLRSQRCRLLAAADYASGDEAAAARPAPLYVGVAAWASAPALYAGHLLTLLTGTPLLLDRSSCDKYKLEVRRPPRRPTVLRNTRAIMYSESLDATIATLRAPPVFQLRTPDRLYMIDQPL